MKRQKEKSRTRKFSNIKQEMREITSQLKRDSRSPSSRSPNRPEASAFPNEEGPVTPDQGTEDTQKSSGRKKKGPVSSKNFKVTRSQDRDYKQYTLSTSIPKNPQLKVDAPSHFKSVESKHVYVTNAVSPPLAISVGSFPMLASQVSSKDKPPCSAERINFIRTFLMLIRMGNRATKEKESKEFVRQLSCEQEEWQSTFSDIIWLELRAKLSGHKREVQDELQYRVQQHVPQVLEGIINFKVRLKPRTTPTHGGSTQGVASVIHEEVCSSLENDEALAGLNTQPELNADLDISYDTSRATRLLRTSSLRNNTACLPTLTEILEDQREALLQVAAILDRVDLAEKLYPTLRALGQFHPLYQSQAFQCRLTSLYLWMNMTVEMGNKLHQMAHMLQIGHLGVEWPWLECSPRCFLNNHHKKQPVVSSPCSPQVFITQPSNEEDLGEPSHASANVESSESTAEETGTSEEYDSEESYEESEGDEVAAGSNKLTLPQKVRFDISDSSGPPSPDTETPPGDSLFQNSVVTSTPTKPNPPSRSTSLLSVSRSSSTISFEESARTAIYRDYADRMLKRTGVTKLRQRLKDLLDGTLQRARGALEKPVDRPTYASVTSPDVRSPDPVLV